MNKFMSSTLMQINPISARERRDLSEDFDGIVKKLSNCKNPMQIEFDTKWI